MKRLPETAICLDCGYSLRGLPEPVCPECGRRFDPADAGTFRDPATSAFRALFARPPERWHRWLVMVIAAVVLLDISCPGVPFPLGCFLAVTAVVSLVVIVFDYLARVVVLRWDRSANVVRDHVAAGYRWQWRVTPVCTLLIASALWYPWPAWVRFRLSQPAFERVLTDTSSDEERRVVGLYLVSRVHRFPNGVIFLDTGTDLIDSGGFLFQPKNQPLGPFGAGAVKTNHRLAPRWFTGSHACWELVQ